MFNRKKKEQPQLDGTSSDNINSEAEKSDINQASGQNTGAKTSGSKSFLQRLKDFGKKSKIESGQPQQQQIDSNLGKQFSPGPAPIGAELPIHWAAVGKDYLEPVPPNQPLINKQIDYLRKQGIRFEFHMTTETYGQVWRVRFKKDNQKEYLACKVLSLKTYDTNKTRMTSVEECITGLMYESNILQDLDHHNIIKIISVINVPDSRTKFEYSAVCMLSELFDGTLTQLIERPVARLLSEDDCKDWFIQIASAVQYLHNRNVCHMNIRPESILYYIRRKRLYKLADFCYTFDFGESDQTYTDIKLDRDWMAPEVRTAGSTEYGYDAKAADIYSLSMTLIAALIGFNADENRLMALLYPQGDNRFMPVPPSDPLRYMLGQMYSNDPYERLTIDQVCSHEWLNS